MAGVASNAALHLTARGRPAAGRGGGADALLSNGKVLHHWQHRVFSDGEVFDPIVEDEVPAVERAPETLRLVLLMARARSRRRRGALAEPRRWSRRGARGGAAAALAPPSAGTASPADFDLTRHASLAVERLSRPAPPRRPTRPST